MLGGICAEDVVPPPNDELTERVGDDLADLIHPYEEMPVPLLLGGEGGVSGLISGVQPK